MKIVGYHIGDKPVANSKGWYYDGDNPVTWLTNQGKPDEIAVLYHLDWAAAKLCKMIGMTDWQGKKLLDKGRVYVTPWTIKYIPGRFLSIDHGFGKWHPRIIFSNAHQYRYSPTTPDKDIGHTIDRAKVAQEVGQEVYDALTNLNLHPRTLVSPINAYYKEVLSQFDLPTVDDYPDEAGEWAYQCCKGSWLEAFKRGHWENVWDYDLNSAYPSELETALDLRQGGFRKLKELSEDSYFAYCRCQVEIDTNFHPILYENRNGESYIPVGRWECFLTRNEIIYLRKHKQKVEILESWQWFPMVSLGKLELPLYDIIISLQKKAQQTNGLKREVIKRIMTGIYGMTIQYKGIEQEMGPLFNPVWAAEAETNTRLRVAEFCHMNSIMPIYIAVDGVIVDREIPLNDPSWRLSHVGSALVFNSGTVAMDTKHGSGDFSLDYNELVSFMRENPEATSYTMKKVSPMTVARALALNRWSEVGDLVESERTIDFGYENKRCWPEIRNTAKEIMEDTPVESIPWDISLVGGIV